MARVIYSLLTTRNLGQIGANAFGKCRAVPGNDYAAGVSGFA